MLSTGTAPAQTTNETLTKSYEAEDQAQAEFVQVGFQQKLNAQVPPELSFRNEAGQMVQLKDYFGERPLVLALVYYECPMLCNLLLNGMVEGLRDVSFTPGKDFDVLAVSFDHEETHVLAGKAKASYVKSYGRKGTEAGWHFLVGDKGPIKELTETTGFSFQYDAASDEFSHRAGLLILTPEGKVSRYLPGVQFEAQDIRFALMDAADGNIGSLVDKLFLLCYHYDPVTGKYGMVINNAVRVACLSTVAALGMLVFVLLKRDLKKHRTRPVPVH